MTTNRSSQANTPIPAAAFRKSAKPRRRSWLLVVAGLLTVGSIAVAVQIALPRQHAGGAFVVHEVNRGDLVIDVLERGNLESANNIEHYCEIEGKSGGRSGGTAILWLIPAGSEVKKGDLLVRLESSYLEDMEKSQRITVNNALSGVAKAHADAETARKAIKEYEDGVYVQQLKALQADLTVAEENLRRSQNNLQYTQKLYLNGFVNKLDVEAAEFLVRNAQLGVDKARTALDVLVNVTKEKILTQLRGDLLAKEALLRAEDERLAQEKTRHESMLEQLTKCKIFAKADGMVVYFLPEGRFGPDEEDKIREGAVVRERQKLIILPDLKNMRVRVLVNESKIGLVRKGQRVQVRVDAMPDRLLSGHVEIVGAAPEHMPWFDREKRNYPVAVRLDSSIDGLKPGMTAQATILIGKLPNALTVPLQCVRSVGPGHYCYVRLADGTIEERRVKLGPNDDRFIQIVEGVAEGEQVIESPESALQIKDLDADMAKPAPRTDVPILVPGDTAAPATAKHAEDKGPPKGSKGKGIEENDGGPPAWSEKSQKMGKPYQPPPKK